MNQANKFLRYRQISSFRIEADRPLHMNIDGEPLVAQNFSFKSHPKALGVVLGQLPE